MTFISLLLIAEAIVVVNILVLIYAQKRETP